MKPLLAALLVMALPTAWAATPVTGCGNLCGRWQLDTTLSAAVEPAVDAALATYSEPRPRHMPAPRGRNGGPPSAAQDMDAAMEQSLGSINDRPQRKELRIELLSLLETPAQLNLDARNDEIVIQGDKRAARRVSPGTPRARVNATGLAKVNASWKADRLTITESYDRKRKYSETYTLQGTNGTLLVIREVQRPGMKVLRIQSVYRRA